MCGGGGREDLGSLRPSRKLEHINTNLKPDVSCQQASTAVEASAVAKEASVASSRLRSG